jgi:hypothetical protein
MSLLARLRTSHLFVEMIASALMVALVAIASAVPGCLQKADCTPHAQNCDDAGVARTCSSSGHGWATSGRPYVPCAAIGGVCTVVGGRVTCLNPRRDAGDDADASDATADASDAGDVVASDAQEDGE